MPLLGPLKILLFTPLAITTSHLLSLASEVERYELQTALKTWIAKGEVRLVAPNDGCFATFAHLLRNQAWHLVIFSGHGVITETLTGSALSLLFTKPSGAVESVDAEKLIQLFKTVTIQCLVLATCHSGQSFNEKGSLAMQFAQKGIPHVIGMQGTLLDRAGWRFIQTFCVALAEHHTISYATQQGCQAMTDLLCPNEIWHSSSHPDLQNLLCQQEFLPILYSQNPSYPLVDWNFQPQPNIATFPEQGIKLPPVFIGRRDDLQRLLPRLQNGHGQRLLIHGPGGIGKTALVGELIKIFIEQENYQVIIYQIGEKTSFLEKLAKTFNLSENLEAIAEKLAQEKWIIWLDGLENIQNSTITSGLALLHSIPLKILVTSRHPAPPLLDYDHYLLKTLCYHDFQRYVHYLGLPYSPIQIKYIYRALHGNFKGIQLLQNLLPVFEPQHFLEKIAIVQRYLTTQIS